MTRGSYIDVLLVVLMKGNPFYRMDASDRKRHGCMDVTYLITSCWWQRRWWWQRRQLATLQCQATVALRCRDAAAL